MTQRDHKRLDVPIRIQVLIPSALCLAILFAALFWVAVPFVRTQLFSIKRDMICELTETVWYLLQQYHLRVQTGELTRAESQSRALERIRALRYGPDSSNYFWILDQSGMLLLHPVRTELESSSGLDITDANGKRFIEAMLRTADEEEDGLVEYAWPRPDRPDLPVPKMAYVRIFQPWGWIIGTGIYVDDLHAEIARITGRLQIIFLGCLAVLAALAIWLSLLSRRIERRRRSAEQQLGASERQYLASLENMLCGFVLLELLYDESGKPVNARVVQVNSAALRIGNLPFDPTGRLIGELFPSVFEERLAHIHQVVSTGQSNRYEKFYPEFKRWLEILAFSPQPGYFGITFTDVTERKAAEEKLVKELALRQMLLDQLPCAAMILKNGSREIVSCNEIARKMGAAPGRTCFSTFDGKDAPCSFCLAPTVWETGQTQSIEVEHHKGGWCECIWIPLTEDLYIHYIFDITERKTAEQALKASEQQLRLIVENSTDMISSHAPDSTIRYISPSCRTLLGYEPEELLGCKSSDFAHPDDAPTVTESILSAIRSRRPGFQVEHRVRRKNEAYIWIENYGRLFYDSAGELAEIQCSLRDITERKAAEQALKTSEQRFRNLVEASPDGIWELDAETRYTYCSPQYEHLLGYDPQELVGKTPFDLFLPEEVESIRIHFNEYIRDRRPFFNIHNRCLRKDGTQIILETSGIPILDEHGCFRGYRGVDRDITERRRNEEALRVLNSRYQAILAAIPDIVAEVDVTRRYTWFNPAGLAFFGSDAVGHYAHEYFIGDQATYQSVGPLFNGGNETVYVESWQRRNDGKRRLLGWWCRPLKDSLGRVIGALSTARDITEAQLAQRQREQLLASLETKNEELQSVLYTASHDLRSPLVNIQGFGSELESACGKLKELLASPDGPETRRQVEALLTDAVPESLHFVRAGADKIQMLLDGLLRLSRVGSIEITLEPLNMNELLDKVLHAQRFQIQQRSAEVVVDPLPACVGDVVMVNQLFSNLIDNAMKYSDPSRPCRIRITGQIIDSQAVYAVADNGIGIEPEHQQEIFQIFYRLHPGGEVRGEGLGLSIVKRIMDRLQGAIRLESNPGQGTTFFVSLPLPDAENIDSQENSYR